jgi:hypothetical protein
MAFLFLMVFLRIRRASEKYDISQNTLRFWLYQGALTRHKAGRLTFINEKELLDKIKADTASFAAKREAERTMQGPQVQVEEARA